MTNVESNQFREGGVELYSVLRSGIRDLQDDRNFQIQRFQTLAIALGAAYGFVSISVYGEDRPFFIAVSLVALNIGAFVLAFFWHAQMRIYSNAIEGRYLALRRVAKELGFKVIPYDLDEEERKKAEERSKRWGPKNTSELQNWVPIAYGVALAAMTILTTLQIGQLCRVM